MNTKKLIDTEVGLNQSLSVWRDVIDTSERGADHEVFKYLDWNKESNTLSGKVADVIIIGGGLAGMVSAYLLSKEGKSVIVLERNTVGSGVTALTTAFLTEMLDTDMIQLISIFGLERARKIVESHRNAIDLIEEIIKEHNIDCDFKRCSNYEYASSEKEFEDLKEEYDAGKKLGVEMSYEKDGSNLGFKNDGYLEFKNQAKYHPIKFLFALADICVKQGVKIYEGAEVTDVLDEEDAEDEGAPLVEGSNVAVCIGKQPLYASWAIVATYEPFNEPLRLYFKKGTYVSYVFEVEILDVNIEEAMFEDMKNPYHYFRIDGNRMIVGGEDHRADVHVDPVRNFNALQEYLETIVPTHKYVIRRRWSGPILEPIDGLAAIGSLDDDYILYATGFSGTGMTYSAIAGMILTDTIIGMKNPWKNIYSASRLPKLHALLVKGKDYSQEMIHGALKNFFSQSKEPQPHSEPVSGQSLDT